MMKSVVLAALCLASAVLGAADLPDRIWEETPAQKANETEKRLSGINGLVSYWDFGEMRPPYRSKGPYEAALSVGDQHGPVSVAGGPLSGRALRFDGTNYLTLPYAQTGQLTPSISPIRLIIRQAPKKSPTANGAAWRSPMTESKSSRI